MEVLASDLHLIGGDGQRETRSPILVFSGLRSGLKESLRWFLKELWSKATVSTGMRPIFWLVAATGPEWARRSDSDLRGHSSSTSGHPTPARLDFISPCCFPFRRGGNNGHLSKSNSCANKCTEFYFLSIGNVEMRLYANGYEIYTLYWIDVDKE